MKAETTIKLCGYDVRLRYCAAAETGYEQLSGKSADVFMPDVTRDDEGNVIDVKTKATTDDYLKLAISAIIAAYAREGGQAPITAEDILYEASPEEIIALIGKVAEIRNEWYGVPSVIKEDGDKGDEPKNG